jgi:NTE family protein
MESMPMNVQLKPRFGMEEHWRAGYHDARRTLRHREALERPTDHEGVFTFDLAADGRE